MPLANILGVDFFNESFDFPKWEIVPKTTLATIIRTKKGTDISLFLLLTENILLIFNSCSSVSQLYKAFD